MRAAPALPAPAGATPPLGPDPPPRTSSPKKGRPASPKDPTGPAAVTRRLWFWLWRRESAWEARGAPFPVSVCVRLCCTGPGAC